MNRALRAVTLLCACAILSGAAMACGVQEPSQEAARQPASPTHTASSDTAGAPATSFYDLRTRTLEGEPADLGAYRGRVVLAVNVASKCGLTPQYESLEALHRELAPRGFSVLGFPSNDFLNQEPGSPEEIREFCSTRFDVTFPLFEKMKVKGDDKSEVYRFLTARHPEPDWNFTKYLIDGEGHVVQRFSPRTTVEDAEVRRQILALLDQTK